MKIFILCIIISILALIFSLVLAFSIFKIQVMNAKIKEISMLISKGAMTFLKREYSYLIVFVITLFIILLFAINIYTALAFILGSMFSMLAGFFGMKVATYANSRTVEGALKGQNEALKVAFSGGSVMGLCVVGLGVLGLTFLYLIYDGNVSYLTGFGLGASSIALFARVGGGIYTKAADVGADLVGKIEAGIPEDDPRNPAVIADNVGDNVGDVAGMGADLFESYVGSLISSITLGAVAYTGNLNGILYPILLSSIGIIASMIGILVARMSKGKNPQKILNLGTYISGIITLISSFILSKIIFNNFNSFIAISSGLIIGIAIGKITEIFTSSDYKEVKVIAKQSETGAATNIISGLAIGMKSTVLPIIFIAIGILTSFYIMGGHENSYMGLYGISLSAVGMLSITGITVAVDAYGPIADNAGGIAEMSHMPSKIREITDKLDSIGNTTAAIGKGFAIGSAALTALALFASYAQSVNLKNIDILNPLTLTGVFIGAMIPFLFSALTMESVGKAANEMVEEVRNQLIKNPEIMEGTKDPDYERCIKISTTSALKEMILPGILAISVPIFTGIFLGTEALGGLIAGALVTGALLALMMANSGGAWDNAKKYIEASGGKGTGPHKATVIGDTVGDPFKDTSGPSMNILIKLMTIVSVVFAPVFVKFGGIFLNIINK